MLSRKENIGFSVNENLKNENIPVVHNKSSRIGLAVRRNNPLIEEKNATEKFRIDEKPAPLITSKPSSFHDLRFGGGSTLVPVEFAEDIDSYLRYLEKSRQVEPNFLNAKKIDGRMRQILVDWMIQVQQRFQLCSETLQLSISTLDRALREMDVAKDSLQLLGVTCLFIAAKFEEIYVPNIQDFVYIAANIFTKKEVLRMEGKVLEAIGFQLGSPYTIQFLRKYRTFLSNNSTLHNLAKFISEVALLDYSLAHLRPSKVASAAIYLASRMLQFDFPDHMYEVMKISEKELVEIAQKFVSPIRQWTSKSAKLQTLQRSYEKLCSNTKMTILPVEALGDLIPIQ